MTLGRHTLLLLTLTAGPVAAHADEPTTDKRSSEQKKEQGEKKGALKERVDPAKDLEAQRANLKQLRTNAAEDRKNGNRVGAWAAEADARHAEKLIKRDEELLQEGRKKQSVDSQAVKPNK